MWRREPSHTEPPPDRRERPHDQVEQSENRQHGRPEHDADRNQQDEQRRDEHARPEENDHATTAPMAPAIAAMAAMRSVRRGAVKSPGRSWAWECMPSIYIDVNRIRVTGPFGPVSCRCSSPFRL